MSKWIYLFVKCGNFFVEDWRPKYINGKELAACQKGPSIIDYCRGAGMRGWEIPEFQPLPGRTLASI